tara:strand:- start:423 stop:695 length:273 start_codon:yes stop_codon:yes gene_type:complete
MKKKAINCIISGRVQGVGFRMSTSQQSKLLGIKGWVKNLDDGRVEVYACGEQNLLVQLRKWLAHGPSLARVINIDCINADYQKFDDFSIR